MIEEIETELTFNADKRNLLTPEGMQLEENYATIVEFDSYDIFVATLSGKETLHDTVGITYQLIANQTRGDNGTQENVESGGGNETEGHNEPGRRNET